MQIQHRMKHTIRNITAYIAVFVTCAFAIGNASAGWQFIIDADLTDTATNPGYPSNQNEDIVGAYIQDLLNLTSPPDFLAKNDSYGGAPLTGLGEPDAGKQLLLAFHFGNGNTLWQHTGDFDVFFACKSDCNSFTLPSTQGVSNYRLYDPPTPPTDNRVPEPESLALFGAGLVALVATRRRTGTRRGAAD